MDIFLIFVIIFLLFFAAWCFWLLNRIYVLWDVIGSCYESVSHSFSYVSAPRFRGFAIGVAIIEILLMVANSEVYKQRKTTTSNDDLDTLFFKIHMGIAAPVVLLIIPTRNKGQIPWLNDSLAQLLHVLGGVCLLVANPACHTVAYGILIYGRKATKPSNYAVFYISLLFIGLGLLSLFGKCLDRHCGGFVQDSAADPEDVSSSLQKHQNNDVQEAPMELHVVAYGLWEEDTSKTADHNWYEAQRRLTQQQNRQHQRNQQRQNFNDKNAGVDCYITTKGIISNDEVCWILNKHRNNDDPEAAPMNPTGLKLKRRNPVSNCCCCQCTGLHISYLFEVALIVFVVLLNCLLMTKQLSIWD